MSLFSLDDRGLVAPCPACGQATRRPYAMVGRPLRCRRCQAQLPPPGEAIEVPSGTVFDTLRTELPVPIVADFWAPWCGPCRAMAPELERAAAELAGEALVVKVNTETHPDLGARYGVRSIPTLLVFRHGDPVHRAVGAQTARTIVASGRAA